ncbi:unnamed protein product [Toxocara canis]|uniref:Cytochrome b n=1 Tax=Toxocara canis TaxID=6265 RepID=A0A183TZT9_TOXCA|nr:unnamed protein product [Toxocara canis]
MVISENLLVGIVREVSRPLALIMRMTVNVLMGHIIRGDEPNFSTEIFLNMHAYIVLNLYMYIYIYTYIYIYIYMYNI